MRVSSVEHYAGPADGYILYNNAIEQFFLDHFVIRHFYHRGDELSGMGQFGNNVVLYIYNGLFKIYTHSIDGQEVFHGYLPQHSVMVTLKSGTELGKFMKANGDCTVYAAPLSEYLQFLQTSPDLILHQINESYHRRNVNEFVRNDTLAFPARVQVYEFLLFIALHFGKKSVKTPNRVSIDYPPSHRDIAAYLGIHRSNVSRFIGELTSNGLLDYSKERLVIFDAVKMAGLITELKEY